MTKAQIKFGFFLLAIQICLLAMTYGFHAGMNRAAEQAGLTTIINEARN